LDTSPAPAPAIDPTTRVIDSGSRWLAQHWDGKQWRIRASCRTEADAWKALKRTEPA
jgi:hypothetical protein